MLALLTPIVPMLATLLAKWSLFVQLVWTFFVQSVSTCVVLTLVTSWTDVLAAVLGFLRGARLDVLHAGARDVRSGHPHAARPDTEGVLLSQTTAACNARWGG